ncbi:MAG: FprA family A-type flavoprotein [Pseudoflavonifractor sp.]|nr:FprA family A-type flavoprotein [Alloprevotella sp.]MCM1117130.1 FprA family A-type flavoprotein [Pseudoflavonifractor sp.]
MTTLSSRIKYTGVDDDNLDLFEGQYPLPYGISYNTYLVEGDEALAIIDSVDIRRCSQWLLRLEESLAGRVPSYLIVQHMEPDHSGSILALLDRFPSVKIVATSKAIKMLSAFFPDSSFEGLTMEVDNGFTLPLGAVELTFFTAPMVHWPEVMVTLCHGNIDRANPSRKGVLFSADAFGSFAPWGGGEAWDSEARRYYANIVGKYGIQVQAMMHKLRGLDFDTIAPLHGPALTSDLGHYWNLYDLWSRYRPECNGVFVAYASIYGGTADAARRLAAMLAERGADEVSILDLCRHDVSYAVGEAFRMGRLALCAATYDGGLYPPMYNFLHHLQMKGFRGRRIALVENGSWAPQAARHMTDMLAGMLGMTIVSPSVSIRSRLSDNDLGSLAALADALLEP